MQLFFKKQLAEFLQHSLQRLPPIFQHAHCTRKARQYLTINLFLQERGITVINCRRSLDSGMTC